MDDMKLLSTEAEGVREAIPEEHRRNLVNISERVGALLGLQSEEEENVDPDQDRHSQGALPVLFTCLSGWCRSKQVFWI
jgi:hypothetical protein